MGDNDALNVGEAIGLIFRNMSCFVRHMRILSLEQIEICKKTENHVDTPVPLAISGRYYSYSKPGGPLSQDTHTSSGLSFYGLGVGT